jgi:hypothetical protein
MANCASKTKKSPKHVQFYIQQVVGNSKAMDIPVPKEQSNR